MSSTEFDSLLADVRSTDAERRSAAATCLEEWQPDADQGTCLIEVAAALVGDSDQCGTLASKLLRPCWTHPHHQFISAIRRNYVKFCREQESQWQSLRVLTELQSTEALKAFVELLRLPESRRYPLERSLAPLIGSFWGYRSPPSEAGVMFPEWFSLVDHLEDTYHVYAFISQCHEAGILDYKEYPEFVKDCIKRARRDLKDLQKLNENVGDVRRPAAKSLEWLLDLFRDMQGEGIDEVVAESLKVSDLPILLFAIGAALSRGIGVPDGMLAELAASPSMRHRLWRVLEHKGLLSFFPNEYRTTAMLAEANMVRWLEFPTEMGQAPEEIEPLAVVERADEAGEEVESYFFKFRHREFLGGEWFVGFAGDYVKAAEPTLSGEGTFSSFLELDSMSVEEHVNHYLSDDWE